MRQHRSGRFGLGWAGLLVVALAGAALAGTVATGQAVSAAVTSSPQQAAGATPNVKPNIVYVLTDDLDQRTTPYWDVLPKTKRLLADHGMTFENSFAPTPICCPARSTILTGQYGHNTGVLTNKGTQGGWETFVRNGGEQRTVAKALSDQAGYHTALIGKYLNGYGVNNGLGYPATYVPPGWSEWYGAVDGAFYTGYNYQLNENGTLVSYGNATSDYSTDVVRDKAIDIIDRAEKRDDAQPLFLYLASTAPHAPLPPPARYATNPYSNSTARHLPNFQEQDLSDKPAWLRASGATRSAQVAANNDTDWQNRMGSLYAVDDMVAAVVAELDAKGELGNTYFVFTSDNGYNLGAHRLSQKMVPYEESLRVPLVIAGPGVKQGSTSAFAMQTDFAPTFYQLAGLPIPSFVDGRSLVPLFQGRTPANWRTDFEVQYVNTASSLGPEAELPPGLSPELTAFLGVDIASYRALRTEQYLYVEWYDEERTPKLHEYELYDLTADPWQLDNILATAAGRQASADLVAGLRTRLATLAECAGQSCRT